MIVTPMTNLIKIDDDDDNIDDYHDWPPFPLWLRSASSIVPISLSCDEALPPSSSQTKPKQTTQTNVVTRISQCPTQGSVVVCGMHWRISSVSMLIV